MKTSTVTKLYFLSFGITWLCWIPLAFLQPVAAGSGLNSLLFVAGAFGPLVAAVIVFLQLRRKANIAPYLAQLFRVRIAVSWYLLAVFGPFAIVLLVLAGLNLICGPVEGLVFNDFPSLIMIFFSSFIFCLGEEVAWRGIALPCFQVKHSALLSSVYTGFFWGMIHLPLFFIQPERTGGFSMYWIFPLFVVMFMVFSMIYTFLFNSGRGSIWTVVIFHVSMNTANELYHSVETRYDLTAMILLTVILTAISGSLLMIYGPKNLSGKPKIKFIT